MLRASLSEKSGSRYKQRHAKWRQLALPTQNSAELRAPDGKSFDIDEHELY